MDDYRYDGKGSVLYSEGDCVVTIIASEFESMITGLEAILQPMVVSVTQTNSYST